jgi:hypothetical protein
MKPFIFGSHDGTEIIFLFTPRLVDSVMFQLRVPGSLTVGHVEAFCEGVWVALDDAVIDAVVLSSERRAPQEWLTAKGNRFLVTKREKKPFAELKFKKAMNLSGLRICNRSDGAWSNSCYLSVGVANRGEASKAALFSNGSGDFLQDYEAWLYRSALQESPNEQISQLIEAFREKWLMALDAHEKAEKPVADLLWEHSAVDRLVGNAAQVPCAISATQLVSWVRYLLSIALQLKMLGASGRDLIVFEFLLRCLALDAKTAFGRLKFSPIDQLDNVLYDSINQALLRPEIVNQRGALVMLGHGVFARNERPSDQALLECTQVIADDLAALPGTDLYLSYGALLGIVRDGRLLPHDDDVDLLFVASSRESLVNQIDLLVGRIKSLGFKVSRRMTNGSDLPFLICTAGAKHVDVFLGWRDSSSGQVYLPMAGVRYGAVPDVFFQTPQKLHMENCNLPIPTDPIGFLMARYGEGWSTPDPLFRLREGHRSIAL